MERRAEASDFEAVYSIYMDPLNNPFIAFDLMDRESFRPIFTDLVRTGELCVYEVGGKVAAAYRVARKTHRMSHVAYRGVFAVAPRFRGRGTGSRVLADLKERLRSEGVRRLELLVVSDNPRAINFYKRLGFEVEGVLRGFLKRQNSPEYCDELMMAQLLI